MTYAQYSPAYEQWKENVNGIGVFVRGRVEDVNVSTSTMVSLRCDDGCSVNCYGGLDDSPLDFLSSKAKKINKNQNIAIAGHYDARASSDGRVVVKAASLIEDDLYNMAIGIEK